MVKDFFQDITPPSPQSPRNTPPSAVPPPESEYVPPSPPERTIRNIPVAPRPRAREFDDVRSPQPLGSPRPPRSVHRYWLWGAAAFSALLLASIAFVALRPTTVTVTPRTHTVVFDQTAQFSAYPAATAASGTLTYTLQTADFDDSETVAAKGIEHVEDKATGTIVVYNAYSTSPVKLIKNTRFESADGHIFRIPAEASVPGMRGATPGKISLTVFADQAGESYNVAAGRFTLPGLKTSGAMYAKVYGVSSAAMSGGFSGDRPKMDAGALSSAQAAVRARLEQKARNSIAAAPEHSLVLSGLVRITYESLPSTAESGGSVRIHERAHLEVPVFPLDAFARTVAQSVSANGEQGASFEPLQGLDASRRSDAASADSPIDFTLSGKARLIWSVDTQALAAALAGKSDSAFKTIVDGFPGVAEAHARIEPFWNHSFPTDASAIKVRIVVPTADTAS